MHLALRQIQRIWGINPFDLTFMLVVTSAGLCYGAGGLIGAQLGGQTISALLVTAILATIAMERSSDLPNEARAWGYYGDNDGAE